MAAKSPPPKRANKAVQLGEMIGATLDPALRRRGFANRDLIANWSVIAPTPYDKVAIPDKLVWPRRDRPDPEGAVLYVRCIEGHGLLLAHEAPAIAAAINRYFGYLLVGTVRLSPAHFVPGKPIVEKKPAPLPRQVEDKVAAPLVSVADEGLREALARLGRGVLGKNGRTG